MRTSEKPAKPDRMEIEAAWAVVRGMLKTVGVPDAELDQMTGIISANSRRKKAGVWDKTYAERGHVWGDGPCRCATEFFKIFAEEKGLKIVEIGSGYGRTARAIAEHPANHEYIGFDTSPVGAIKAQAALSESGSKTSHIIAADLRDIPLKEQSTDVVISHRTLHLMSPKDAKETIQTAHSILNENGILCLSTRSFGDFKDEEMSWINKEKGVAEYNKRPGHIINFYDKESLYQLLEESGFVDIRITAVEEIESLDNPGNVEGKPVMTQLLMVVARKPTALELAYDQLYREDNTPQATFG